jgi:mercuric ion binding protein
MILIIATPMKHLGLVIFTLALLATTASAAVPGPSASRISLRGLVCAYCAQGLSKNFKKHPEIENVEIRLNHHDALLTFKSGQSLSESQLRQIVKDSGLDAESVEPLERAKQ